MSSHDCCQFALQSLTMHFLGFRKHGYETDLKCSRKGWEKNGVVLEKVTRKIIAV